MDALEAMIFRIVCVKNCEQWVQDALRYRRKPRRHFLRHMLYGLYFFVNLKSIVIQCTDDRRP